MSGFLSRKYLEYRGLVVNEPGEPRIIDEDLPCRSCGYNLRGLDYGRNCPECGNMISRPAPGAASDPLLAGDEATRRLVSMGLLIGAMCLIVAAGARLLLFTGLVLGIGIVSTTHYFILGFVLSALWCAACLMMIRARPRGGPRWNNLAMLAAWSQVLWIPGYILFAMRVNATATGGGGENILHFANLFVRGLAGIGALGVAFYMMRAAEDAELEDAARRLNSVIWVLPIFTILTAHVPPAIPWIIVAVLFLLLLAWSWFLFTWARSYWEMHRHVAWNARLAVEHAGRYQRIDERKRELQEEVEAKIRPLGRERPIVYEGDRFCKYCHYNLRGVRKSSLCPECGKSVTAVD